jgi:hypothetical protein
MMANIHRRISEKMALASSLMRVYGLEDSDDDLFPSKKTNDIVTTKKKEKKPFMQLVAFSYVRRGRFKLTCNATSAMKNAEYFE